MKFAEYDSSCGKLLLGAQGGSLCLCDWMLEDRTAQTLRRISRYLPPGPEQHFETVLDETRRQLDRYFAGTLIRFDLPLTLCGTEFQRQVWMSLRRIPYGEITTYKDVAEAVSLPRGVRAVAAAIGANPLSLLIPCHRIIGSDGTLTGYAGGLEAKRYLLRLEGIEL